MNSEKIKLLLGGAAGGAIVLAIIGFAWGGLGYGKHCSANGCDSR